MISVINCIVEQHNIWLVLVAAVVCVAGCWAVVRLHRRGSGTSGAEAIGWQFLAATAAGASIWATHFIAIIAYEPGTPVSFDPVLTIISLMVALIGSFAGLMVAGMIHTRWAPAAGGAMVGFSVATMHYTGMMAYVAEGVVEWDIRYLVASIVLAAVITACAVHVASRRDHKLDSNLAAVGLLTLAIVSLHFTGMTAFRLTPLVIYKDYTNPAAMQAMALSVALVSLMIVGAVLASYLIDGQTRAHSLSQLKHMAMSDPLTGLANRASYNEHLDARIKLAANGGQRFALAAIDLDRFKEINDLRGHSAGDETLKILAQRMRDFNDGSLFIARIGGDEFSIIMPVGDRNTLRKTLMKLRAQLLQPFTIDDCELMVGASIGICIYPDDANDTTLVNNTDLALYRAKTEIADKICFFDNVMDEAVRTRRELAAELRHALEHDQLEVFYQVQTSVSEKQITGYEALLRWQHPQRGYIPPSEFIPLAEESGLILQLGEWVLRTACTEFAALDLRVAVNLSPIQFLHPNLPGLVADILAETGMKAVKLELELTESAIIHDKERTLMQLQEIRKLGVTIALDDFGTGYSSLDTLRAFPFDKIKLDRTFMEELETSEQARSIIRAVLALGKSLAIPVLAEGIETRDQLAILRAEGCDSAQGYYLGRPAPLATIFPDLEDANIGRLRAAVADLSDEGDAEDKAVA